MEQSIESLISRFNELSNLEDSVADPKLDQRSTYIVRHGILTGYSHDDKLGLAIGRNPAKWERGTIDLSVTIGPQKSTLHLKTSFLGFKTYQNYLSMLYFLESQKGQMVRVAYRLSTSGLGDRSLHMVQGQSRVFVKYNGNDYMREISANSTPESLRRDPRVVY